MRNFPTQIQYLAQMGALDIGDAAIEAAKKEYKRMYKRESKKRQRSHKKEYRPLFTKEEVLTIQSAARSHHKPISTFIHDAALAYIAQVFILPHPQEVRAIEKSLSRIYLDIRSIKEKMERREGNPRLELLEIMRRVEELERELVAFLRTPPLLTTLVSDALATTPHLRQGLLALLES